MIQNSDPIRAVRPRVALMVDGDNLSSDQAGRLMILAGREGEVVIRRVYGNAANLPGWCAAPGFHFRHAGPGKNAADLLLTVEAMEVMLLQRADVLVIASSDRDFSHLATHLREAGSRVIGLGEAKAPETFRRACNLFAELPLRPAPVAQKPAARPVLTGMEAQVAAQLKGADPAGLRLVELAERMKRDHDVRISDQPQKTWRSWLGARPVLFDLDPKAPDAKVRLKT